MVLFVRGLIIVPAPAEAFVKSHNDQELIALSAGEVQLLLVNASRMRAWRLAS